MTNHVIIPISDPGRGWRVWNKSEIYTGNDGGRYVPNVDDAVWDWTQGLYRVTEVDYTTGLSVLTKHNPPAETPALSDVDILLGGGPGPISESYRVYIDTSVMPHSLAVDSRLRIYSTDASSVKLFRGTDIGANGDVISKHYDQNGTYLGENIPVVHAISIDPIDPPDTDAEAVKVPVVGYTTDEVEDGELITAVVYGDEGNAISICKLLAKNTAFARTTDASQRYVTGVSIESPFLSESDPRVLEYPINMPIQALGMMGVVSYSDGGVQRLPIDGTKFTLHGLDTYIATILGQELPLVLTYKLSSDEIAYDAQSGSDYHISEPYTAKTIEVDGAYSVKLFVYPVWIDMINGYRLEYFLYNLEREDVYLATPHVELASNSPTFNPTLYGTVQNLTVAVDLDDVNGLFSAYRHVQTVGVSLLAPGSSDEANWQIQYTPNQPPIFGGEDVQARITFINAEFWNLTIDCGAGSMEDWLSKVYYPTQPLYNPTEEVEPPEPNFFRLVFGNRIIEEPINQWNAEMQVPNDLQEGETLYLEFFKRTAQTDLELGIAGLPVHQEIIT